MAKLIDVFVWCSGFALVALTAWAVFFAPRPVYRGDETVKAVQKAVDEAWRPWIDPVAPLGGSRPLRIPPYECADDPEARIGTATVSAAQSWIEFRDRCDYEEHVADWARAHAPVVEIDRDGPLYVFRTPDTRGMDYRTGDLLDWSAEPPGDWALRCPPTSTSLETGTMVVMNGAVVCLRMRAKRWWD